MPAASNVITQAPSDPADPSWRWLFRLGAVAAIVNVLIIPIQIIVYMISPPPEQVADWFAHLIDNPLMALLNLDLLYLVNNALLIVIYLALFVALRALHRSAIWVALAIGIVFFAIYTWRVAEEARRMSNALAASQLALAREQQLAALGGLAAAAAHELGSPLGTIAVVSREIARDLTADSPISEDVDLLISETARCREC